MIYRTEVIEFDEEKSPVHDLGEWSVVAVLSSVQTRRAPYKWHVTVLKGTTRGRLNDAAQGRLRIEALVRLEWWAIRLGERLIRVGRWIDGLILPRLWPKKGKP